MRRTTLAVCGVLVVLFALACGGGAAPNAAETPAAPEAGAPAAEAPAAAAVDDAPKFAGKWKSDAGQFTEYVYEDGKLYTLFGSERSECTLEGGEISYRAAGMNNRMNYRFLDDDTIEYTSPSAPGWSMVQKRQP